MVTGTTKRRSGRLPSTLTPQEKAERTAQRLAPYKDAESRRAVRATLPDIDVHALYPIPLALCYLDCSRTALWKGIKEGRIKTVPRGRRKLIPGTELVYAQPPAIAA